MKRLSLRVCVAGTGIVLASLLLAACGPRTPNAAAETPFNPTAQLLPAATNPPAGYPAGTSEPPAATLPPDSYPAGTVQPPPATAMRSTVPGPCLARIRPMRFAARSVSTMSFDAREAAVMVSLVVARRAPRVMGLI